MYITCTCKYTCTFITRKSKSISKYVDNLINIFTGRHVKGYPIFSSQYSLSKFLRDRTDHI